MIILELQEGKGAVEPFGISKGKGGGGGKMFLLPIIGDGYFLEYFMEDTPVGLQVQ